MGFYNSSLLIGNYHCKVFNTGLLSFLFHELLMVFRCTAVIKQVNADHAHTHMEWAEGQ